MGFADRWHGGLVHPRRVRVLAGWLAQMLPEEGRVLDVGTGDGWIASRVAALKPGLSLEGIDTIVRDDTQVPVTPFDGERLPFEDDAFDALTFVDVLHHTEDPATLLREAARVARRSVVIKDHLLEGVFAGATLRFMDDVGNARHGVALPHNYWPRERWLHAFDALDLRITRWETRLGLYPWPLGQVFERSLHFVSRLEPAAPRAPAR